MILIIGGAYQGKLDFVKENYGISGSEMFACNGPEINFTSKCIYHIESFTANHPDPVGYFEAHRELWHDSILIMDDISCGVVPMGAENRAWRQKNGRLAQYLSREATQVSRIFCGLEHRLK